VTAEPPDAALTDDYFDLGPYSRTITTTSPLALQWFNRGLIWAYAFNHLEAVACFKRAAEADPSCAMAYWGISYAGGPYYNKQWHKFDQHDLAQTLAFAFDAIREAVRYADLCTPVEAALIEALSHRYQNREPAADLSAWNDAYADAMRTVYERFPDDLDVCTLFVDAMMNRTPWALWDLVSGQAQDGADTLEAIAVVQHGLGLLRERDGPDHAGLLHVYIHLMEMSPTPEAALEAANRLRTLTPGAAHLCHMPTHIDVQCGHYEAVVESNRVAVAADRRYMTYADSRMTFHTLSRAHNFHFMLYGAMLLGHKQAALEAAQGMVDTIPEALLRIDSPPMADWLEGYVAMNVHAYIRFGEWRQLIDRPEPADPVLYSATTAMLRYGKTLAHAVLGDISSAENEKAKYVEAVEKVPASRCVFNNSCQNLLAIASQMLDGELLYRKGLYHQAFSHLRRAVELSDALPYDEPWGWMQPARHALGALLLEQGCVSEALTVYQADLGLYETTHRPCRHPDNVWALHGYHECLVRQDRTDEATAIEAKLRKAIAGSDITIASSCFCRRGASIA